MSANFKHFMIEDRKIFLQRFRQFLSDVKLETVWVTGIIQPGRNCFKNILQFVKTIYKMLFVIQFLK